MTQFNNSTPEQKVRNSWGKLSFYSRVKFYIAANFLAFACTIKEDIMSALPRFAFLGMVVLYIGFFLAYADRLPRQAFVAGVILGVILGAVSVLIFMPRHHNGNNHSDNP